MQIIKSLYVLALVATLCSACEPQLCDEVKRFTGQKPGVDETLNTLLHNTCHTLCRTKWTLCAGGKLHANYGFCYGTLRSVDYYNSEVAIMLQKPRQVV